MNDKNIGALYLLPSTIGDSSVSDQLPANYTNLINEISHFIVEDERTARRFLRSAGFTKDFNACSFSILNEHTKAEDTINYLKPTLEGFNIGLLSDAGCPCVADPGAIVVSMAQAKSIKVHPVVGPSSILLSLMGSGFNGQSFRFIGYLPIDKTERNIKLKEIEKSIRQNRETQIFIEAPYRNKKLLDELLQILPKDLKLCVAANLQSENEIILTKTVSDWKKIEIEINKQPTVFLINL